MISPRQILDQAIPRSGYNVPGVSGADAELLLLVTRSFRALWAAAARINPGYFGEVATVSYNGTTGWPRPTNAELVDAIEKADGTEVSIVPREDRSLDGVEARLWEWGQLFRSPGGTLDPTTEDLTFYISVRAPAPATLDTNLDDRFPDDFTALLVEEVAIYLALKDGPRSEEAAQIRVSRDSWLRLYLAHLDHATGNIRRRFHPRRFAGQQLVPFGQLFAGGTDVAEPGRG